VENTTTMGCKAKKTNKQTNIRRNAQGYKKRTKYFDNNFNPEDRRQENLFNCGMDKKYHVLPDK
jgi:hypothetical protein